MLRQLLLVILACLLKESTSQCPSITDTSQRTYPAGHVLQVRCTLSPGLYYDATCQANNKWNHDRQQSQCSGQFPANVQQAPPPPPPPPPPPAVQLVLSSGNCQFIPEYMNARDASRNFPETSTYDMRCANGRGTFRATCQKGSWVYPQKVCTPQSNSQGIFGQIGNIFEPIFGRTSTPQVNYRNCPYLTDRMLAGNPSDTFPHSQRYRFRCSSPTYQDKYFIGVCSDGSWNLDESSCGRTGIFGNFGDVLGGLFRPAPAEPTAPLKNCPYLPTRMEPEHASTPFPHASRYGFACRDYPKNVYYGTCNDGTWSYDETDCQRRGSFGDFGQQFNNVLGFQGDFPWWILLV